MTISNLSFSLELNLNYVCFLYQNEQSSRLFSIWMIKQRWIISWNNDQDEERLNMNKEEEEEGGWGLKIIRSHDIELYKSN